MGIADLFRPQGPPPALTAQAVSALPSSLSLTDMVQLPTLGTSRAMAMSVPTIAACRNLICGTVAQMLVTRSRGTERVDAGQLLSQPDPSTTWAAQIAATVEDLMFYGRAAWLVLRREPASASAVNPVGLPVRARHIPAWRVEPIESEYWTDWDRRSGYTIDGKRVAARDVIWFDAAHEGALRYGARTIAQAYEIENAAKRMAAVELPAGVLENQGHELGPDEAADVVSAFQSARQTNSVAFLQNVTYTRTDMNAHDLQMVEARAASATMCAQLFGVNPAMVGASPLGNASALLYANLSQNTAQFVQSAVGPILSVLEQTLSLETVTPRGQQVRFEVGAFLRTDPDAAMTYATQLVSAGVITTDEARSYLGIPPQGQASTDMTPGRV